MICISGFINYVYEYRPDYIVWDCDGGAGDVAALVVEDVGARDESEKEREGESEKKTSSEVGPGRVIIGARVSPYK
jgi:hypothetical protein